MVGNYISQSGYAHNKLENRIYLFSSEGKKKIFIDHQTAYISGLTETPTVLTGFNISFSEETSLDERYAFQKTLRISINGRLEKNDIPNEVYAIIQTKDGVCFFTNPDFSYKLTYSFNLSEGVCQTDITLSCLSNMPTLIVNTSILPTDNVCKTYMNNGVKSLKVLEKEKVRVSTLSGQVITTDEWKTVEFLKNSLSLQETYDGNSITATIQFTIGFNDYKSDWQYRLLEFKDNRYTAVVEANDNYKYYVGFMNGLGANYTISTSSQDNESDIVSISLVEISNYGIYAIQDLTDSINSAKRWVYVSSIEGIGKAYECWGVGTARFFIKQEVDYYGNPTGRYKMLKEDWDCLNDDTPGIDHQVCIDAYSKFLKLNIIGTFDDIPFESADTNYFASQECAWYDNSACICNIETDIPDTINYASETSYTYNFTSSCDWSISNKPSFITVSPTSGIGESSYTVSFTNSLDPEEESSGGTVEITCGGKKKYINVVVQEQSSCFYPEGAYVNCLSQPVQFAYYGNCIIEVDSATKDDESFDGLSYQISNNQLIVNVPNNFTPYTTTYKVYVKNCGCNTGLTEITIIQRQQYQMWATNCASEDDESCDYICSGTSKYKKEYRYTGTTTGDWSLTGEFRAGGLISTTSSDCSKLTKYQFLNHYVCVDGDKYKLLEEQESLDGGTTWQTTGLAKLGDFVEASSDFCNQTITYSWVLTDKPICANE